MEYESDLSRCCQAIEIVGFKLCNEISEILDYSRIKKEIEDNRDLKYNASLDLITKLEKEKKIFVLRPSQLIPIGRLEKDKEVIQQMYDLGVSDCNNQLENLKKYLRG